VRPSFSDGRKILTNEQKGRKIWQTKEKETRGSSKALAKEAVNRGLVNRRPDATRRMIDRPVASQVAKIANHNQAADSIRIVVATAPRSKRTKKADRTSKPGAKSGAVHT
jgi:hypothetical protein